MYDKNITMFLHGVQCQENKKMNITSQLTVNILLQIWKGFGMLGA